MFLKRNSSVGAEKKKKTASRLSPAKTVIFSFLVFCFVFSLFGANLVFAQEYSYVAGSFISEADAMNAIKTNDKAAIAELEQAGVIKQKEFSWTKLWNEKILPGLKRAASNGLHKVVSNVLNDLAYKAAVNVAWGGAGQKPKYYTEDWGEFLGNVGDNAMGTFIETLGRDNGFLEFNLCEPDFNAKIKMGLGLVNYQKPGKPECTFSKMKENWDEELKSPDFLSKFQSMFNPNDNDLGIALSLQTGIEQKMSEELNDKTKTREEGKGWLEFDKFITEKRIKPPGYDKDVIYISELSKMQKLFMTTQDLTVDAINTFANSLAIEAWRRAMYELTKNSPSITEPHSGEYDWLSSKDAGPANAGLVGSKERLNKIIQPNFTVRGDYNILAELTLCPDPTKAGPTNCVISDNFRQAIAEKLTVGEAIEQGYLNSGGVFGFKADGLEPAYNEGYPYRSMIILRKFRILPVGWEVGGQYVKKYKDNPNIGGGKNLGELVACFDQDDEFGGYYADWCAGLVDPNWVLKAPLNYCKRAGAGPEIVSEQITGKGKTSKLEISRNDNYCADEQSCIKENNDGSCQLYGYCTEERRKWEFEGDACEPKYNTCQTFKASEGNTISYLENTLDYSNCSPDTAGCKWYCQDYDFSGGAWTCGAVADSDRIYFDRDAEECVAENEGCHEFIRTKPGLGANLIFNSSFEDDLDGNGIADEWNSYGPAGVTREIVNDGVFGTKAQRIVSGPLPSGGNTYGGIRITMPFPPVAVGEKYTISFYAKKGSGSQNRIELSNQSGIGDPSCLSFASDLSLDWQRYSKTCVLDVSKPELLISSFFPNEEFFIDAIKIEKGEITNYSDYGQNGLVYQKLAPDYLACDGIDDPAECDNFARQCGLRDVGCEMYSSARKNISVPAKVIAENYCPAECVGYDIYVQKPATFDSARDAYFIPETAKTCSAKALGCDEFTNLDTIARGGEEKEYYSALRQCIKPGASCADFYTWEGSDETGYQLRVFSLKNNGGQPDITEDDLDECDGDIYKLPSDHPMYNADCREFYNRNGQVYYHLISRTITCSDDCKTFRRSEKNIDTALDINSCKGGGDGTPQYLNTKDKQFEWIAATGCYYCKNGGYWSDDHNACLYDAIPGEGQTCSAAESGCREYAGNTGNNVMTVASYNFEGSTQDWTGEGATVVSVSSNALMVGGNSLKVSGSTFSATVPLGSIISQSGTYVLSFLAKADSGPVSLTAKIAGSSDFTTFDGQADLSAGDWGVYQFNLIEFKHSITDSEKLVITGNGNFYLDDVKLTQIKDKYYLIKNSWQTPESCLNDIFGNPAGALYNLGCDEYTDRDNITHYLHSFNRLCQESVVGCELMIDTHNSSDYKSEAKNDTSAPFGSCEVNEPDCAFVPADNYIYVVYDREKECSAEDKGCQFLGESFQYEGEVLFEDKYIKNNPDQYNSILCSADAEGCEEWFAGDGASYFKDPKDQACDWRLQSGSVGGGWGWFKKKVKRCDEDKNGSIDPNSETNVCLADRDCGEEVKCVLDNYDYACPVTAYKTIGQGGLVYQPGIDNNKNNWAGFCPASESGCTEFADPISVFAENEIYNESFSLDLNNDTLADGWSAAGEQETVVLPDTFYIMAVNGENSLKIDALDENGNAISGLLPFNLSANEFSSTPVGSMQTAFVPAGERKSLSFITGGSTRKILVTVNNATVNNGSKVELKKAVIEYQLEQDVNSQDCNGVVNFENGCVLFNKRAQDGTGKLPLSWDANLTYNDGAGLSPAAGSASENNANILLKVRPNRECGKWLACRDKETIGEESVCLGIGVCDKFNDKGECDRFIDEFSTPDNIPQSQKYPSVVDALDNLSGYAKIGLDSGINTNYGTNAYPYYNDYYKFGEMETDGVSSNILNWDFEDIQEIDGQGAQDFGDADVPYLGWICDQDSGGDYACETIDDPVEAQDENVCFKKENKNCFIYAPSGRSFLKVINRGGSNYSVSTEPGYEINVAKDRPHMLTAYINTDKISDGKAKISIIGFRESSTSLSDGSGEITRFLAEQGTIASSEFDSSKDKGWRLIALPFTTWSDTTAIRIKLSFTDGASGSYYIDNIRIKPTLKSRENWKTHQSCQLYPLDDSLSCEYYDNSGIRYKGQYGYCLEYDRYPGSSDVCLLWWPTPDGADRVNEYCGNGVPDGEEDCDCGSDAEGNPIFDCFSGPLPSGVSNIPPLPNYPNSPSPYGSHKYNQYRCVSCIWTDGWCGDGIVQSTTNSEHCDWNDINASKPNLKEQTCWSDHSLLGDLQGVNTQSPNHYAQYDFAHDGYIDYLWGDLGCYNNSAGDKRCTFNTSGCSDLLVNGSTTGRTRKSCIDAGGVVVKEKKNPNVGSGNGEEVTYPAGHALAGQIKDRGAVGNDYNYFCKFSGASCAGGWSPYGSPQWTTTQNVHCEGNDEGTYVSCFAGVLNCTNAIGGCNGEDLSTDSGSHPFAPTAIDTSSYCSESIDSASCGPLCFCQECNDSDETCTAQVIEVGCY